MAEPIPDFGTLAPSDERASRPSTSAEGPSGREQSLVARAPRGRLRQLDALRGVAILLVLGEHRYVSDLWSRVGWTGVDLFFVLSGFLISGLLFNEYTKFGAIRFGRFFMRRGLKIYPGYYVLLAYFFSRNILQGRGISHYMLSQLVFIQNYVPGGVDYTWSLAVEEHFYVLLPLSLILLHRYAKPRASQTSDDPFRLLPWLILAVAGALIILRAVTCVLLPYDIKTHHMATHLRIDSLLFGVLIGYWYHFHRPRLRQLVIRWRKLLVAASCCFLLLGLARVREDPWANVLGLSCLYLGYGGVLLLVLPELRARSENEGAVGGVLDRLIAILAFVGSYSYAIYLWHAPAASGGMHLVERLAAGRLPSVAMFGIYVAMSVALGAIMTKLVEVPVLRWRDRLLPPRGTVS